MRLKRRQHRPRGDCHTVDNGNVGCPVRHVDVDIDCCFLCAAFEDLVKHDGLADLYCRPSMRPMHELEILHAQRAGRRVEVSPT